MTNIIVKGAKTHNLKNIDIEIPRNKINVLVGVSGSGKSTIAYDIIAAEGQRQFLESISTFAARLLKRSERADIDSIKNLSPTIAIDQKKLRGNARSTVGTSTEIYAYLRLLFSRFGSERNLSAGHFSFNSPKGACFKCKGLGTEYTINPESIIDFNKSLNEGACQINIFKPGSRYFNIIKTSGKLDLNKPIKNYSKEELDFLLYSPKVVLSNKEQGFIQSFSHEGIIIRLIGRATDLRGTSNNKEKSEKKYWIEKSCEVCSGGRLNKKALNSKINQKNIGEFSNMQLDIFVNEIRKVNNLGSKELIDRIIEITNHLIDIDLGYLSLNRSLNTLSGGESQRLKLARELGSDLIEMVYVLDEPTAGLHPKDRNNLIKILHQLKQARNTVIVVEHDDLVMQEADHIIEIGPGAGIEGGKITFKGSFNELKSDSLITGKYFAQKSKFKSDFRNPKGYLAIKNAKTHNLKNINVKIPLEVFCSITGVSGSGKSSLIVDEFIKQFSNEKIVLINQSPLTGTARGDIATYTGIFSEIRNIFAKENNVSNSLFSSNSKGACFDCKGLGFINIDMHFMGDVKVKCETCLGKKYQKEILKYTYKSKNINDVLNMTVNEANNFFKQTIIKNKLKMLIDVGLGYLTLGQTHDTFSGGEAQRLKLASKLNKKGEIFILDEPTSGLHFADIEKLLNLLNRIIDNGNSVIVIEHNLDVIRQSDWIIDMGPKGGEKGGKIIAEGTPIEISKNKNSITGRYLF
ncbi:excinuclease ABC subunit UvrA [Patescibacteria group bacterium]|nr:excinuclease ABC subunit UvrA [Patescibacteria group bacterium]MBU4579876.1 excinuclease ABC subunit UvrA [Patescibacteria group bacterium]